jgi:signal transduction histidine kinase
MITPASHLWSALTIHVAEGGGNLVQLLEQQGYELTEEMDGPAVWRSPGSFDMALLDLTQASQSGTVLFVQTISQLNSPLVLVCEAQPGPADDPELSRRHAYVLQKKAAPAKTARSPDTPAAAPAPAGTGETPSGLLRDLKVRSSISLASGLAHDVNNFLTVVSTCASLLQEESLSPRARGYVDDIRIAGDRAAALLQQLYTLCRRHQGQPQVLDLNELLVEMRRLMAHLLGDEIELVLDLERHPCHVKVDPRQVEQILLNLVANARDAIPGKGTLCIATATVHLVTTTDRPPLYLRPGRYVQLALTDTGCGMTEEVRSRIFEPFFSTKDPSKGTGIGLATVDRIIRGFGGQIEVESTPGHGTTFRIYLPDAAPAEAA